MIFSTSVLLVTGIAAKDGSDDWFVVRGEQFSVGNVEKDFFLEILKVLFLCYTTGLHYQNFCFKISQAFEACQKADKF